MNNNKSSLFCYSCNLPIGYLLKSPPVENAYSSVAWVTKNLRYILTKSGTIVVFSFGVDVVVVIVVPSGPLGGKSDEFGPKGTEKSGS
jgi:hypothetical protein